MSRASVQSCQPLASNQSPSEPSWTGTASVYGSKRPVGSQWVVKAKAVILDRTSFVPLYYQLQEKLKQQIESGLWVPGDRLPSEAELAETYEVSRVVVRRALAILADDLQVRRVKGSGTFVVRPKLGLEAGGLSRLLRTPRPRDVSIIPLDLRRTDVEGPTHDLLGLGKRRTATRVTTLYKCQGLPLSITYSYFGREHDGWLARLLKVGKPVDPHRTLEEFDIRWTGGSAEVETSLCGTFEANQFGIPPRSAVFVVLATEFQGRGSGRAPLEVARGEYRGDIVKLVTA